MAAADSHSHWTAGDVLDLEVLCANPAVREDVARDRESLVRSYSPVPLSEVPRPALFRKWLELRRPQAGVLPGSTLDGIFRFARVLGWTLGMLLGASAAGGYLLYFGREPVNPFWFFLWLVVIPLLVSAGIIALAVAWRDWSGPAAFARWAVGAICKRLPGSARSAWHAWSGLFARHRDRHARLAVLPLLGVTQRAACGFALGALITLWLRVVFTDLAFGWQSSAGWPAETWHRAAAVIASPWTWLFPGACPTVEQVRDSHFTFAAGMQAISPGASQSWWPFLAASLAVWGGGVRLLVILYLGWNERRALQAPDFSHSDANALYRALTGPLFAGQPPAAGLDIPELATPRAPREAGRAWIILVPDSEPHEPTVAARAVAAALGGSVASVRPVAMDDPGANTAALAEISDAHAPVAVLLPAARDPILAIKKTLASIAAACAGRECVVLLQGAPARLPLWRKFAAAHQLELEMIPVP